jgi:flagellar protein FliS
MTAAQTAVISAIVKHQGDSPTQFPDGLRNKLEPLNTQWSDAVNGFEPYRNTPNGVSAYQEAAVATQSKGRLIVLLYDGAIKFMKLAIKELEAGNYEAKGRYIGKAQDIINELNAVLNTDAGGEVAANLRSLYVFMNTRLSEANTKRDHQMIREVIKGNCRLKFTPLVAEHPKTLRHVHQQL